MALSPDNASSVTGFGGAPKGTYNVAASDFGNGAAAQAQTDLGTAYTNAASALPTQNLTGQNLGSLTLTPGAYKLRQFRSAVRDAHPQRRGQHQPNLHIRNRVDAHHREQLQRGARERRRRLRRLLSGD